MEDTMQNRRIEVSVSPIFRCELDEEMQRLLDVFGLMVDWWSRKLSSGSYNNYSSFRKRFYRVGKKRWGGWNSQHLESSGLVAFKLKGGFKGGLKFAVLSPLTVRVRGSNLVVSTQRREFGSVALDVSTEQKKTLLQLAENSGCRLGQVFLTERWAVIPFILAVNLEAKSNIIERLLPPRKLT